jgi:tripartite-type tricarboxylate transporter receptor subunit TctC
MPNLQPFHRALLDLAAVTFMVAWAVALLAPADRATAQTRTIKIVNPYPPGGTADIIARLMGEQIGRAHGVTMLIENRPGGGTVIGTEAAARAAPDGNTLLISSVALVINPHLRKVNYDPLTSFEPVCNLVQSPQVIVVNSASPYRTLAEFANAGRARAGTLTLGSTGPASPSQIAIEMVKRAAGLDVVYVPFPGNAPTINAVLGGHVSAGIANYADVVEHLKAGTLRALATHSPTRIEALPDLPTAAQSGFREFEYDVWFGILAPAKTSTDMVVQLSNWFLDALRVSDVRMKLVAQGLYPAGNCGADFARDLRRQFADYGRVIREANIKGE